MEAGATYCPNSASILRHTLSILLPNLNIAVEIMYIKGLYRIGFTGSFGIEWLMLVPLVIGPHIQTRW